MVGRYLDNVSAFQYFQILRFSVTLLISIILVKSSLPIKEIAIYEMILFLSNALSFFWANGLKNGLLIYYPKVSTEVRPHILFNVFILLLLFSIVVGGIFFCLSDAVLPYFVSYEVPYKHLLAIYIVLSIPASLIEIYYVLSEDANSLVRYASIIFLLKLGIILFCLFYFLTIESLIIGLIVWAAIAFIWLLTIIFRLSCYKLNFALLGGLLGISLPLIFQVLVGSGVEFVDGFIISKFYDADSFLIYRYGARELPFVILIISAMKTVMIARSVDDLSSTLRDIKQRTSTYMKWMFPLTILTILISPIILPIIYSADLKESAYILNIYACIITSRILLPQVVMYGHHKTILLFVITFLELILNVSLSLILMKYFGIIGIASATVISYMVAKCVMMMYNKAQFSISFSAYIHWRQYFIFCCITIFALLLSFQY